MAKADKVIVGIATLTILLGAAFLVPPLLFVTALTRGDATKADLVANYQAKKSELLRLKTYFNARVPAPYQVEIRYDDDDEVDLKVYRKTGPAEDDLEVVFQQWRIDPYDYVDRPPSAADVPPERSFAEVKKMLGWNDATFAEIKRYLDEANCLSVSNGEPTKVGYAYRDLGLYSYNLFSRPLPNSLRRSRRWNDSCTYLLLTPQVVLEYGGGAIGPQCFPDADARPARTRITPVTN